MVISLSTNYDLFLSKDMVDRCSKNVTSEKNINLELEKNFGESNLGSNSPDNLSF